MTDWIDAGGGPGNAIAGGRVHWFHAEVGGGAEAAEGFQWCAHEAGAGSSSGAHRSLPDHITRERPFSDTLHKPTQDGISTNVVVG